MKFQMVVPILLLPIDLNHGIVGYYLGNSLIFMKDDIYYDIVYAN